MIVLGVLLLTLAVLAFVGYPLLRQRREEEPETDERGEELFGQRDATYSAIKELQFDYQLGNLSAQDHQALEEKYKHKAATILKQLDNIAVPVGKSRGPEEEIEEEILRRRRRRGVEVGELVCPSCGKKNLSSAKFCSGCGSALELLCPRCGAAYTAQDRFCSQCGASLASTKGAE